MCGLLRKRWLIKVVFSLDDPARDGRKGIIRILHHHIIVPHSAFSISISGSVPQPTDGVIHMGNTRNFTRNPNNVKIRVLSHVLVNS